MAESQVNSTALVVKIRRPSGEVFQRLSDGIQLLLGGGDESLRNSVKIRLKGHPCMGFQQCGNAGKKIPALTEE